VITVFNAPADRAALASYRDAGIARVLFKVTDLSRDEVLRVLDKKTGNLIPGGVSGRESHRPFEV
jgi:hypothetical protein